MSDFAESIYLDYQASCPVDPRVADEMEPFFRTRFGNYSSSQHAFGATQREAVELARSRVASVIDAENREVIFTSGATESNNLAIQGFARSGGGSVARAVTTSIEHPAVLKVFEALSSQGWEVAILSVDSEGRLDLDELQSALERGADLVSVAAVNNEIGVINPIAEIAKMSHHYGAKFHTDAAQAVGLIPINVVEQEIDLLSLSGHKLYGPQGVGALYVSSEFESQMEPISFGGGQERGLRSGSLNTPGAVGLGMACELLENDGFAAVDRIQSLRNLLAEKLSESIPSVRINGPGWGERHAGNLHLTFFGAESDAVMANCPGVAMAAGSACSSAAIAPSHVLTGIGMSAEEAECSLRLSLGRFTTEAEIDSAVNQIAAAVGRVRALTDNRSFAELS